MIFTEDHARQVLDRSKWQTRRPVRPGEELAYVDGGKLSVIKVYPSGYWRVKWQVGRDYAVQTGRGKKGIGRTPPIEAIGREGLQEISLEDIRAEGIQQQTKMVSPPDTDWELKGPWDRFIELWNSLYRKPYRWEDPPFDVWVLVFEKVKE